MPTNWDGSRAPGPTWGEQAKALGRLDPPRSGGGGQRSGGGGSRVLTKELARRKAERELHEAQERIRQAEEQKRQRQHQYLEQRARGEATGDPAGVRALAALVMVVLVIAFVMMALSSTASA